MADWWGTFLGRACGIAVALLFTQIPLFMEQYSIQLSGRVAELKLEVDATAQAAAMGQKSLQSYIDHFVKSSDPDFAREGELMQSMVERYALFSHALHALKGSSPFAKPLIFMRNLHWEVSKEAVSEFQIGMLLNLEGIAYGAIGFGVGYALFALIRACIRACMQFFKHCFNLGSRA